MKQWKRVNFSAGGYDFSDFNIFLVRIWLLPFIMRNEILIPRDSFPIFYYK